MESLAEAGFDIVHPFDAHACAREAGLEALADPARPQGWLVGNTRALWPKFLAARDPAAQNPLDDYTERACERVTGARCFYAHRKYAGAFLPFQRLAVVAGLGTLSPTQLVIHPVYGPWFALRAVLLCAGDEPITRRLPAACSCTGTQCMAALAAAQASRDWRAWLAVRDSCTVGREYRYSDDQIAYHYTKAFAFAG